MQQQESDSIHRVIVRRALAAGDPGNIQLYFEVGVLDRYREAAGFSLIRTNTVGRLKKEGAWAIDFGIAPDEEVIHASIRELLALPEEDRTHWSQFSVAPVSSKMFLQMRLAPSACYDDGEVRKW